MKNNKGKDIKNMVGTPNVVVSNSGDSILNLVKSYLYSKNDLEKCPHCGNMIDAIIVGRTGIRCEFCRNRNPLEDLIILGKVSPGSVVYMTMAQSVSEVFPAEKDDKDEIVSSASVRLHLPDEILNGTVEEFFNKYTGIVVIADKEKAKAIMPYIDKEIVNIEEGLNNG